MRIHCVRFIELAVECGVPAGFRSATRGSQRTVVAASVLDFAHTLEHLAVAAKCALIQLLYYLWVIAD